MPQRQFGRFEVDVVTDAEGDVVSDAVATAFGVVTTVPQFVANDRWQVEIFDRTEVEDLGPERGWLVHGEAEQDSELATLEQDFRKVLFGLGTLDIDRIRIDVRMEGRGRPTAPRFVFLDPDGTMPGDWIHVVVEAPTGVVHQQQYGGTACRQGQVEGFLVPVSGGDALGPLRELFEGDFKGAGVHSRPWPDGARERLRRTVAGIPYWACDGRDEERCFLRLDEDRFHEVDEAWVPVVTPDGPGILVWRNSD